MAQPHVFCLHHTDETVRKTRLQQQFAELGLAVEWVETYHPRDRDAWDHEGLSGESIGETSCALKHRDALRRQVERQLPVAVMLEDDVDLPDSFAADLERWLREFAELDGDVLMIGTAFDMHVPADDPRREVYLAPDGYGRATHAYAVSLRAAEFIVPRLELMPKGIGHDLNDIVRANGLRMCWVEPGIEQLTLSGRMLSAIAERRRLRHRVRVLWSRLRPGR
jgi:glycosyl transferase family 25